MSKVLAAFPHNKTALTLVTALSISACSVVNLGTPYERPALEVPTTLPSPTGGSTAAVDPLLWWKSFQDPVLDGLLQEAAEHNQDLVVASARVTQARAVLDATTANLYPTLDLTVGASKQRLSQNSSTTIAGKSVHTTSRQVGLSASYEIDFWGKYANADKAAKARLLAASAHRATVLTSLYADVAQNYMALLALDAQLTLAEKTAATGRENLRLQQLRFDAGIVSNIDLAAAKGEAAAAEITRQTVQQGHSRAQTALAVLLGRQPAQIMNPVITRGKNFETLYAAHVIPANLPSDVLKQRPDVISAEQALIAAHADIAIARASYFPSLSLTATFGRQSGAMSNLFEPASTFWSFLANLTQPIFHGGALGAMVAAANAQEKEALAQYTQAVQNAFRDVHDAFAGIDASEAIAANANERIAALRTTLQLAELRYQNGYSSYLEVLSSQRDLTQAEMGLIEAQRAKLAAVVGLYKAVGGGWDPKLLPSP